MAPDDPIRGALMDAAGVAWCELTNFETEFTAALRPSDLGWIRGANLWRAMGERTELAGLGPYAIDPDTREIILAEA